ncbi:hypothetical protein F2Q68_00045141 [Brassica cretica]|uniref:CCHC-type domain-containing protein n=1 Tax=Brassica cretica TaxID=69181 RepID=A0A8S9LNI8_BRACR|nr:hypothetical protein F2Q68_00045141 [Brassica cretica]
MSVRIPLFSCSVQRVAVSNKPKVVHQCNNMKVRQEVLKHGCAAGTRKETDWCISNCVRPSKKQHRMCCWLCGKLGHKKVECFAREKSKNMAKKVNKTFIKPKRVENVSLAKSGLLDEIKDKTSEDGCSSVRSDPKVDQEASSLEPGHEVVCGTKGKEIERALGVDGEWLLVKKTTHNRSQILNKSWSKGSSTGASGHDAILVIPLQQGLPRIARSPLPPMPLRLELVVPYVSSMWLDSGKELAECHFSTTKILKSNLVRQTYPPMLAKLHILDLP